VCYLLLDELCIYTTNYTTNSAMGKNASCRTDNDTLTPLPHAPRWSHARTVRIILHSVLSVLRRAHAGYIKTLKMTTGVQFRYITRDTSEPPVLRPWSLCYVCDSLDGILQLHLMVISKYNHVRRGQTCSYIVEFTFASDDIKSINLNFLSASRCCCNRPVQWRTVAACFQLWLVVNN